ncbi:hypothetical protein ABZZ79_10485 [Streptomyces sp. NPDC006458]|uniref:Rv1733c family protein n=1 Tax=Streptomyces sp. NPDC006458 TaxID=3154302 RepID=UPI0033A15C19
MRDSRKSTQWLWRWRNNPLRRHDDVVEGWILLAVWLVALVGGIVAGVVTARAADATFARQRAERTAVQAVVIGGAPSDAPRAGTVSDQVRAKVRWTAPDGSARTGIALVDAGHRTGSQVVVWQDTQGTLAAAPPTRAEASVEAGLLGTAASVAFAGTALGAAAVTRWRMDKRRMDRWDREWELVGPRWGGHMTG